ncbi:MAG TPA: nitronate monooxygenase, partial [Casimicrobiaceae bacterium]|nr:nitronate monooxygenase [Casimicrobiaceae bacterium]
IGDGRGLAAALMLGAHGALIGTRFYASTEALGHDRAKQRIAGANSDETARTRVFDVVRGYSWPPAYDGRALRNRFFERWHGHEAELSAALENETPAYRNAAADGDIDTVVIWAGEVVDLIDRVEDAPALVARISAEAETHLRRGSALVA